MNQVFALKAFEDNYIWVIQNQSHCLIVDPGESAPVIDYLNQQTQITPVAILITHHHSDHVGGVQKLTQIYPNLKVYGPKDSPFTKTDYSLVDGQKIHFNEFNLSFDICHIPGHTLDHIAYYNDDWLFCGDTLFSVGCGRMFEGTASIFQHSLEKLRALSDDTLVFCAHEYTQANIRFALTIDTDNQTLLNHANKVKQLRQNNQASLPTTLKLEKAINPFIRTHIASIQAQVSSKWGQVVSEPIETFAALRALKDRF
ncbi:hydroxyacylglutathione hydrolase [Catenovulum adriaticum]|uniref:Hydroxyacylglutathione hydrolase n=1 Tax=Catenovulum adriaticum TaxID=2984846 RepID=A0ABY7AN59_9ALTE|nr:hydroxyacylglutathione hydrolase [Catenovulum sp. TS8]WAJ70944.1 hydroxyacylglutathione hydrolase [Catenovulum sp. TS8]